MAHKVAIVGRPNVGKSTLFNRLAGRRQAITERAAGTTRDRVSALIERDGTFLEIVDTGGFGHASDHISQLVKRQIEAAVRSADTILFTCDITAGITPQDEEVMSLLRKSGKPIIVAANKADNEKSARQISEFFAFGVEDIYAVSALHNIGISSLMDKLQEKILSPRAADASPEAAVKVAIVGRPNVGKSSFINRILSEERVIVHEKAGTTRDSIDIRLDKDTAHFILIDTAGMRHKRKVKQAVDVYSLLRGRESIVRSDVCLVMVDGYEGLMRDDMRILQLVEEAGRGCVLLVNKWDMVKGIEMAKYEEALLKKMKYIKSNPVLFISCKTGLNVDGPLRLAALVDKNMKARFSQGELKSILDMIYQRGRIPVVRSGKPIKIYSIRQKGTSPPAFALFVNKPAFVTDDYLEAVKNILRGELGLTGVPIKLYLQGGGE